MGEAVKRQDYKLPELALSDRAHQNITQCDRFVFPVPTHGKRSRTSKHYPVRSLCLPSTTHGKRSLLQLLLIFILNQLTKIQFDKHLGGGWIDFL
jgi:hypothetical protein